MEKEEAVKVDSDVWGLGNQEPGATITGAGYGEAGWATEAGLQ